jgi:transposase
MAYPIQYRQRALEFADEHGLENAAATFKICPNTLRNWRARQAADNLAPNATRRRSDNALNLDALDAYVKECPDLLLAEYGVKFNRSAEAIRQAFRKLGISRKKITRRYVEQDKKKEPRSNAVSPNCRKVTAYLPTNPATARNFATNMCMRRAALK